LIEINSAGGQDYINNLVEALNRSFIIGNNIEIDTSVDEVYVDHSFAVSLGLIINELVSNCIKYAFPLNSQGKIMIKVERSENDMLKITVADNGKSSKEFKKDGLGFLVVKSLAEQYSGNFNLKQDVGTTVTVNLKLIK
jgi:two-component system, sensor histidine kinase PdtaS